MAPGGLRLAEHPFEAARGFLRDLVEHLLEVVAARAVGQCYGVVGMAVRGQRQVSTVLSRSAPGGMGQVNPA